MAASEDRNKYQIRRHDNRGCFVEVKSDWFIRDQVHFEFATYDRQRPEGDRFTNHVNAYVDGAKFLALASDVMSNAMLQELRFPTKPVEEPLFENLGGTSAEKLLRYNAARSDGMSQSRVMKILRARKRDAIMMVADTGPGEANKTGLIIPRFGRTPEGHVSVMLDYSELKAFIAPAEVDYKAYRQAIVAKKTMDGEFDRALDFQNNNATHYPQAVNFNG